MIGSETVFAVFVSFRLILSHFWSGKQICLEKVMTEHTPNLDF